MPLFSSKQRRTDFSDYCADLSKPEQVGLVAGERDFELGTPNLKRKENVILIASNTTSKESLLVRFKWRPSEKSDDDKVTLLSKLTFIVKDDEVYEYEAVETYQVERSGVYPDRVTQYGSRASKLKLYIASPYRRMRLVFNGQMRRRQVGSESSSTTAFVKLSVVMNTVSKIFDFLEEYEPNLVKSREQLNLLLHDRHENKIKLNGEYQIVSRPKGAKVKRSIALWGYHVRHFVTERELGLQRGGATKRLYAIMDNGQSFHIGKLASSECFGYTCFDTQPLSFAIDKQFTLNFEQFEDKAEFDFEISGQRKTFNCIGKRRELQAEAENQLAKHLHWYEVKTNNKPGWAWASLSDELEETPEELEAAEQAREASQKSYCLRAAAEVSSTEGQPLVVAIDEAGCSHSELVGAKAASLAQLAAHQMNAATPYAVSYAVVLTRHAHDLVLGKEDDVAGKAIENLKQLVVEGRLEDLRAECEKVEKSIAKEVALPEEVCSELINRLKAHYGDLNLETVNFAVRSSSWGEDEDEMSAAGQLKTLLNVRGNSEELREAILACFASKFSYENVEYKRQRGLPLDLPMAVVVQEMVACDRAGVMFTCDPTNGDDSLLVITANYGLGESVVSAQADPDTIKVRVDWPAPRAQPAVEGGARLSIEEVNVGTKKVVIEAASGTGEQRDLTKCCLSDAEALLLARCGLELRNYFNCGERDFEFGFARLPNGAAQQQLYMFQSRPVTGLESYCQEELLHECERATQSEKSFMTRANIGEVMPYAIRPLSLTYIVFGWMVIGARMVSKLMDEFVYVPQCGGDVFYECYHAYFSLRNGIFLSLSQPHRSVMLRAMEISMFGREMGPQPDLYEASEGFSPPPNVFDGFRYKWATKFLQLFPSATVLRQKPAMNRLREQVRARALVGPEFEQDKLVGYLNQFKSISGRIEDGWKNHINIIMSASKSNATLSAILSKHVEDPNRLTATVNKFLALSKDVISAEIPERVRQMAELIASQKLGDELAKFQSLGDKEALEYLRNEGPNSDESSEFRRELAAKFCEFFERHGHRCYNEFELAELAWREDPKQIVDMIRGNCRSKAADSNGTSNSDSSSNKRPTVDEILDSLGGLTRAERFVLKHQVIPKCQLMLSLRERTKDILVQFSDIAREASRALADELRRQMRLPDAELMYYVYYDELLALVRANQPSIVLQATRRRKLFRKCFAQKWLYDEIIRDNLVPNNWKEQEKLDKSLTDAPKLFGTPASDGCVRGEICLVNGYDELDKVKAGCILLTHSTDIAFSPVFPLICGLITEVGGLISHGAVVAREYGLPCLIGIPKVTQILQNGEQVILDADNGTIVRLGMAAGGEVVAS